MRATNLNKTSLLAALAGVLALAGCGDLGELSGRIEQPQLVTKQDLARYPSDSPERTTLAWWRALQFDSSELAARYYSERLGLTPKRLDRQLRAGPAFLDLKSGLRIRDVVEEGDTATVLAVRTRVLRHPNGRVDEVRVPQAVDLRREQGEWRLANNRYLDRALRNLRAFVDQGRKSGN